MANSQAGKIQARIDECGHSKDIKGLFVSDSGFVIPNSPVVLARKRGGKNHLKLTSQWGEIEDKINFHSSLSVELEHRNNFHHSRSFCEEVQTERIEMSSK